MLEDIVGTWVSGVRQTDFGPMKFVFRIGGDGRLEINGTPVGTANGEEYRRSGTFQLQGDRLVSPVLNEGKPVRVALQDDGQLALTIDEALAFRLRRE